MLDWVVPAGRKRSTGDVDALRAGVAQLVEQLIRNQQVRGSSPRAGSIFPNNFDDLGF